MGDTTWVVGVVKHQSNEFTKQRAEKNINARYPRTKNAEGEGYLKTSLKASVLMRPWSH